MRCSPMTSSRDVSHQSVPAISGAARTVTACASDDRRNGAPVNANDHQGNSHSGQKHAGREQARPQVGGFVTQSETVREHETADHRVDKKRRVGGGEQSQTE